MNESCMTGTYYNHQHYWTERKRLDIVKKYFQNNKQHRSSLCLKSHAKGDIMKELILTEKLMIGCLFIQIVAFVLNTVGIAELANDVNLRIGNLWSWEDRILVTPVV